MLDTYTRMLLACTLAVVCWGGAGWASWRLACRWLTVESLSVRCCGAGVVAFSFVVIVLELLGSVGALRPEPVAIACAVFALLAWRVRRSPAGNAVGRITQWTHGRLREGYAVLACVVAVMIFWVFMRALRCPPLSWDSLTYHAFLPARWVQLGGLVPFAAPGGMDGYRALPINLELLVTFAMLPFGSDLFANCVNMPVMLSAACVSYALAREIGTPARIAIWAPILFCFAPPVWGLVTTQYNDVAMATGCALGVLFLIRYLRTDRKAHLFMCAAAFGLACGTRCPALPITGLALVMLLARAILQRAGRRRACLLLLLAALPFGIFTGAYQYVHNWVHLGNPVYPVEVAIAGNVWFEGSPMLQDVVQTLPKGDRARDVLVLQTMFSAGTLSWGPKFVLIGVVGLLSLLRSDGHRRMRILLLCFCLFALLIFFAPTDGIAERTRRLNYMSSSRMIAFAMLAATCLAVSAVSRLRWPRVLLPVVPVLALVIDVSHARYPQPPSLNEAIVVVAITAMLIWWIARRRPISALSRLGRSKAVLITLGVAILLAGAVAGVFLEKKRNRARYIHYAESIDFHDIPRYLVDAWQACDEPDEPHVVTLIRPRRGGDGEGIVRATTDLFFYPLLGSQLQNCVVHASIFEPKDLPSKPYRGGLTPGGNERIWLANLHRLGVDRILLVEGALPEGEWLSARPDIFIPIQRGKRYTLYRLDREALASVPR